MPTITGNLQPMPGARFLRQHPENLPVIAIEKDSGQLLAQSELDPFDSFELDIPVVGPVIVEIRVALPGVAPITVDLDDIDATISLYFDSNQNSRL